ncbi:MAG: C-GCAxxG-C-C family protein [Candidatus Gastranaerophilales bacterium]|nr:C-GCAxxG-C-C family protein [Candidatus Gastranaerophilales bacterium]
MLKDKATQYYQNGFSCSESIIKACIDENLCPDEFLPAATAFSAGMSSGCLCGAVAAAQMVSGYNFGRNNKFANPIVAREKAATLIGAFKEKNKVTCCRALSSGLEGAARKEHCTKLVSDAAEILEELIKVKI